MKKLVVGLVFAVVVFTFIARAADVSRYLVGKGQELSQTNASTVVVLTNERPFRFTSFVEGVTNGLLQSGSLKLPNGQTRTFTNEDGTLNFEQGFTNKAGLDAAYATGGYQFTINSLNDGTNKPTLPLAAENYPNNPRVINWPDLQAVEPEFPLLISWNAFTNGNANDYVLLEINETNDSPVVSTPGLLELDALNGTNTIAQIPANALDYGRTYEGRLLFLKRTALALTNYPGAGGVAGYYRQTKFPLTTLPEPPNNGRIQFSASSLAASETSGSVNLTLNRAGHSGSVSVEIFTSGGTATAGEDYDSISQTIEFADDQDTATVPLTITDDYLLEGNETVNVWLANAAGGAILGTLTNLTLTIRDNEIAAAGKIQFSATNYNVVESNANAVVTFSRINGTSGQVSVSYVTEDLSAEGLGVDYGSVAGTLVFSNGISSRTVNIPLVNDSLDETNEQFRIKITATSGGAAFGTNLNSTVTILDNESGGTFAFNPKTYTFAENVTNVFVTVARTGGAASGVTVDFATQPGTAVEEFDFVATNGTLTFGSNELSKTFPIRIVNNFLVESNESFTVLLSNPTGGATLSTNNLATLTIRDEESNLSFTNANYSFSESASNITINVLRTGALITPVSVNYATADDDALAGTDYIATNGTLFFPTNVSVRPITIRLKGNTIVDGSRDLELSLSSPQGGARLGETNETRIVITDDDLGGAIRFSTNNYVVSETGTNAVITLLRTGGKASGVTVKLEVDDGSADAGLDYTNVTQIVTFNAGETNKRVLIPIINDTLVENPETVELKLEDAEGGASIGSITNALLTINSEDLGGVIQFSRATNSVFENATNIVLAVTRTGGKASGVSVEYRTRSGTATEEDDFAERDGTINFGANETNKFITIPIFDDVLPEGSETFTVVLHDVEGGATLGANATNTVTIVDDESSISISKASYVVGEGATNVAVTFLRSGPLLSSVSASYATVDDSATAPADYIATNNTLVFTTNVSSRTVLIRIVNDTLVEDTEDFQIQLFNPQGGTQLGTITNSTIVITNNDFGGNIRFSTNSYAVNETGTNASITLLRTGGLASGVTVKFKVEDGTADPGLDYSNVTQIVTFNAGETNKRVLIPIINDALVENPETVLLSLEDAEGGASLGTPASSTLTITSEDIGGVIGFSRTNYSVFENATNLLVTVTRTGGKASNVEVHYRALSGTATVENDFSETEGQLTFAANETNKVFNVPIVNDSLAEGNETFTLELSNVTGGATLGSASNAVVTIADDESSISISNAVISVSEAGTNAVITLVRSGALLTSVSVSYSTFNDTAIGGSDFIATNNATVTFPTNTPVRTILIPIINDGVIENSETFTVRLSNPQGGVQLGTTTNTTVTINDNDTAGAFKFSAATYTGSEGASVNVIVQRTGGLASGITVQLTSSNGTATNNDYANITQLLTFAAGETNKTIAMALTADFTSESVETVNLALSSPSSGGTLGSPSTATVNINNVAPTGNPFFFKCTTSPGGAYAAPLAPTFTDRLTGVFTLVVGNANNSLLAISALQSPTSLGPPTRTIALDVNNIPNVPVLPFTVSLSNANRQLIYQEQTTTLSFPFTTTVKQWTTAPTALGSVTITEYDPVNKIVAGTFTASAMPADVDITPNAATGTCNITSGSFRVKCD